MRGMVDGGRPIRVIDATVIVEAPVNGIDGPNVAFNAWQFARSWSRRAWHPALPSGIADAVKEFVARLPVSTSQGWR